MAKPRSTFDKEFIVETLDLEDKLEIDILSNYEMSVISENLLITIKARNDSIQFTPERLTEADKEQ